GGRPAADGAGRGPDRDRAPGPRRPGDERPAARDLGARGRQDRALGGAGMAVVVGQNIYGPGLGARGAEQGQHGRAAGGRAGVADAPGRAPARYRGPGPRRPAKSRLAPRVLGARGGKDCALVALGMTLSLGLTIYGPWLLRAGAEQGRQALSAAGWAGVATWLATTGLGLLAAHGARLAKAGTRRSRWIDLLVRVAPWIFVFGLLVALSLAGHVLLQLAGPALEHLAGG